MNTFHQSLNINVGSATLVFSLLLSKILLVFWGCVHTRVAHGCLLMGAEMLWILLLCRGCVHTRVLQGCLLRAGNMPWCRAIAQYLGEGGGGGGGVGADIHFCLHNQSCVINTIWGRGILVYYHGDFSWQTSIFLEASKKKVTVQIIGGNCLPPPPPCGSALVFSWRTTYSTIFWGFSDYVVVTYLTTIFFWYTPIVCNLNMH